MAYEVAARIRAMRETRGERPVGRKIGFTNRTVWSGYGISGPIWNTMFDDTVSEPSRAKPALPDGLPEPRIEPEIVLHLQTAPRPGMTDDELAACVDWFAPGFEIVSSIFPGWAFSAADAVAAYGVHSALFVGARRDISGDRARWRQRLENFTVAPDERRRRQAATAPPATSLADRSKSLQFLVDELARLDSRDPLRAGEIVTTGTLTEAMPAVSGQTWSASFDDPEIQGLQLRFT